MKLRVLKTPAAPYLHHFEVGHVYDVKSVAILAQLLLGGYAIVETRLANDDDCGGSGGEG